MKNPYILTCTVLTLSVLLYRPITVWSQDSSPAEKKTEDKSEVTETKEVATQDEDALRVVKEARSRLFQHKSVQADITQLVSLGDYRFRSSGKYLAGEEFKSRIEYAVKLGNLEGTFLEVCDGQILHSRRQISEVNNKSAGGKPPKIELARRDINKILRETQLYLDQPAAVRAAEIGIGGLPAILASLERTMIFESVKEEIEDEIPVLIVQGSWNKEESEKLAAGMQGLSTQIMQFMPDKVRITFNKETLFPQKFQYLKEIPQSPGVFQPLLTVAFENAAINQPIPANRFNYIPPPGTEERDETAMFIEAIKASATIVAPVEEGVKEE